LHDTFAKVNTAPVKTAEPIELPPMPRPYVQAPPHPTNYHVLVAIPAPQMPFVPRYPLMAPVPFAPEYPLWAFPPPQIQLVTNNRYAKKTPESERKTIKKPTNLVNTGRELTTNGDGQRVNRTKASKMRSTKEEVVVKAQSPLETIQESDKSVKLSSGKKEAKQTENHSEKAKNTETKIAINDTKTLQTDREIKLEERDVEKVEQKICIPKSVDEEVKGEPKRSCDQQDSTEKSEMNGERRDELKGECARSGAERSPPLISADPKPRLVLPNFLLN
uniref:PAM2 domain-containing protein n=1 Tax=Anisakis simplex TaxID=6269 RepID=A0A0M3JC27_ANISI